MEHFVYIIYSAKSNCFYKGYTTDPDKRLGQHNRNLSRYTALKGPWSLVYLEKLPDKKSALIREKQSKKYNHSYIHQLINQPQTIISKS